MSTSTTPSQTPSAGGNRGRVTTMGSTSARHLRLKKVHPSGARRNSDRCARETSRCSLIPGSVDSNEQIAFSCHTAKKLQAVRQGAYAMLRRPEVAEVKSRIDRCVTEGMLYIRSDRNLHRDVSEWNSVLRIFMHPLVDQRRKITPLRSRYQKEIVGCFFCVVVNCHHRQICSLTVTVIISETK